MTKTEMSELIQGTLDDLTREIVTSDADNEHLFNRHFKELVEDFKAQLQEQVEQSIEEEAEEFIEEDTSEVFGGNVMEGE